MNATAQELVNLLPADEELNRRGIVRLVDTCPINLPYEDLERALVQGQVSRLTVNDGETPVYVVWYWVNPAKNSLVIGAANIATEFHFTDLLQRALVQLAKEEGCDWIEFSTKRRGLARLASRFGYEVDTVNCVRRVQ